MALTLHTTLGDMKVEVFCEQVPRTAENFLALAASGYYDGTVFHRNIKGFMGKSRMHPALFILFVALPYLACNLNVFVRACCSPGHSFPFYGYEQQLLGSSLSQPMGYGTRKLIMPASRCTSLL